MVGLAVCKFGCVGGNGDFVVRRRASDPDILR